MKIDFNINNIRAITNNEVFILLINLAYNYDSNNKKYQELNDLLINLNNKLKFDNIYCLEEYVINNFKDILNRLNLDIFEPIKSPLCRKVMNCIEENLSHKELAQVWNNYLLENNLKYPHFEIINDNANISVILKKCHINKFNELKNNCNSLLEYGLLIKLKDKTIIANKNYTQYISFPDLWCYVMNNHNALGNKQIKKIFSDYQLQCEELKKILNKNGIFL